MKPLIFLTTRSVYNGIRRAITTPRRLISVIIFCAYYYWLFMRPTMSGRNPFAQVGQLPAPATDVLHAVVFALFVGLSLLLMLGMFSRITGFRPADVDMLFATPISPRLVLGFRIMRDYLTTLIVPLVFAVLAFRPASMGWQWLFRNMRHPESSAIALRAITVAWLLMALGWVSIGYAVTLYTNRSDLRSDRNRKVVLWSLVAIVAAMILYLVYAFSRVASAEDAIRLADSPVLRAFFFAATFSSQMVMAPLTGDWGAGAFGVVGLLGMTALGFFLALRQSGWMYDQAATRGFGSMERRAIQQRGDMYAMVASRAREGKMRAIRQTWLHRLRWQGPKAIIWKDIFMQRRGMGFIALTMFAIAIFMNLMPALAPLGRSSSGGVGASGAMFVGMQAFTSFIVTMSFASTGFMELLRRVDLQKPLPFSPGTTVFMEVLSKSAVGILACWLSAIMVVIINPPLWQFGIGVMIAAPGMSMVISSATFLLTLMFPDVDDPSQRTLRGLLQLIAIAVLLVPGIVLGLGGFALGLPPMVVALPVTAANIGVAIVVSAFAGNFYATYNPSE